MTMEPHPIRVAVGTPPPQDPAHAGEPGSDRAPEARACLTPRIDIHDGPEGLVLEADLPGASESEVSIQLADNILTLHARIASPAPEGARALLEEYRVGDFYRSFILSDDVERSRITAELRNGVLRLLLPRAERAKTRRIEIKS